MELPSGTKNYIKFCVFFCIVVVTMGVFSIMLNPRIILNEDNTFSIRFKSQYPEGMPVIQWDYDDEEKSRAELFECLSNLEKSVCIIENDNIDWEYIGRECFWVSEIATSKYDGDNYMVYKFSYYDFANQNKIMTEKVKSAANDILSKIPDGADEWEAAKIIHDELIKRITFDKTSAAENTHDIYGALVNNCCVCQGYCYAFEYIEKLRGAKCVTVASETHGWNKLLSINSEECYLDITWDDYDMYDEDGDIYIVYDNFFLTKEEMESLESHKSIDDNTEIVLSDESPSFSANYYKHNGWYLEEYDSERLFEIFREQYESGRNILTVRFGSSYGYDLANESVADILRKLGYVGTYSRLQDKNFNIVKVALYVADDE